MQIEYGEISSADITTEGLLRLLDVIAVGLHKDVFEEIRCVIEQSNTEEEKIDVLYDILILCQCI